nr:glycoside hydrolase family 3 N-terminal domain-containing protein [uncultured Butyrivibrio sp.]
MGKNEKKKGKAGKIVKTVFSSLGVIIFAAILVAANTVLPTYGRMINEITGYRQSYKTPSEAKALDLEYNKSDYDTVDELKNAERAFNEKEIEEGAVLLKHVDGYMPYEKGTTFSLFSHSSIDYITGSLMGDFGGNGGSIKDALVDSGFNVNETLWKFYSEGNGSSYKRGSGSINYGAAEDFAINEVPLDVLTSEAGLTDTFDGTTAIFVLSRVVGEGRDMPRSMYSHTNNPEDQVKSYLEPNSDELATIGYLNDNFDDVLLLVNTCGSMELGWVEDYPNIHNVIYTGLPGTYGLYGLANILSGDVNPSGHLVDTYAYDAFSSPAVQNYGSYYYLDENGEMTEHTYLSYEEGIYVGYKYYETRYEDAVLGQGNAGNYDYESTVQYPFGFGLSLTDFEWSDYNASWNGDTCNISVTVKNTGNIAGKDVVQIYLQTPYTDYDIENKVEKAAVQLVTYGKTDTLEPGQSQTLELSFDRKELRSYDYINARTYIVDAGDYYVTAATDAHAAVNNILSAKGKTVADGMTENGNENLVYNFTVSSFDKTTYAADSETGAEITNLFDDANGGLPYLTRNDWAGTFPTHDGQVSDVISTWGNEINGTDSNGNPASFEYVKQADADVLKTLYSLDSGSSVDPESFSDTPVYGAKNGLTLSDVRGLPYDDEKWEALLDQLTAKDYNTIITSSGYGTLARDSVGKPYAMDADAANGLVFGAAGDVTYSGVNILAQTYNTAMAEEYGRLISSSALMGSGTIGWYCPAMNIHRTPFSGRNNEYPSEDATQAGIVTSNIVYNASSNGMYTYIKHFALNDQENHRGDGGGGGVATWSNEQAIREIYLKPFETCIKLPEVPVTYAAVDDNGNYSLQTGSVPATNALMTSFNRLGATWTGGNYNLLTGLLRNEWGFNGFVITDANGYLGYMDCGQMIEAGGDGSLRYLKDTQYTFDKTSSAEYHYARQAAHHHLYTVANSNAMNGAAPGSKLVGTPNDVIIRIVLTVISIILIGLFTFFNIRRWRKN